MPTFAYELRVAVGAASLLPLLGLPVFALLQQLLDGPDGPEAPTYTLVRAFELILPLAGGLAAAQLMTVERDEGMAELRRSYPEPRWRLPLVRTGIALALTALAAALGGIAFSLAFEAVPFGALLAPALGPALFLLGLSLLAGNVTGSYWVAAGLVMGYWFLEIQTRGDVTGALFLFQYAWPVEQVSYTANRWTLAGLGLLFLLGNAWLSARPRGRKGMRPRGNG